MAEGVPLGCGKPKPGVESVLKPGLYALGAVDVEVTTVLQKFCVDTRVPHFSERIKVVAVPSPLLTASMLEVETVLSCKTPSDLNVP